MINLLTDEYKKKIKAEYRKRIFSAAFLLLFFLILISMVLLVPSYIILKEKLSLVKEELSKITPDSIEEISITVKTI